MLKNGMTEKTQEIFSWLEFVLLNKVLYRAFIGKNSKKLMNDAAMGSAFGARLVAGLAATLTVLCCQAKLTLAMTTEGKFALIMYLTNKAYSRQNT
jgi:hypothetical protein